MKLWLLNRLDNIGWDEVNSMLIRAENETEARVIAADNAQSEPRDIWLLNSYSEITEITTDGLPEVIIQDVNWG